MTHETLHPHAGMTDRQRQFLTDLCEQHNAPFNGTLTQAEARYVIAGMLRDHQPTREQVRNVPCPKCNAASGDRCFSARGGRRDANHLERIRKARPSQEEPFRGEKVRSVDGRPVTTRVTHER